MYTFIAQNYVKQKFAKKEMSPLYTIQQRGTADKYLLKYAINLHLPVKMHLKLF